MTCLYIFYIYIPVLERFKSCAWNSPSTLFLGGLIFGRRLIFGGKFLLVIRRAYIRGGLYSGEGLYLGFYGILIWQKSPFRILIWLSKVLRSGQEWLEKLESLKVDKFQYLQYINILFVVQDKENNFNISERIPSKDVFLPIFFSFVVLWNRG